MKNYISIQDSSLPKHSRLLGIILPKIRPKNLILVRSLRALPLITSTQIYTSSLLVASRSLIPLPTKAQYVVLCKLLI